LFAYAFQVSDLFFQSSRTVRSDVSAAREDQGTSRQVMTWLKMMEAEDALL